MGRSRKEEFIAKERSKKVNNMISTELAGEAIPASDTEAVRELCVEYAHNKDEYLVYGARLTCDKALPLAHINSTETILKVPYSVARINGKKVAIIKDHEINVNIKPFECNCANGPLGNEQNTITDLEDCRLHGTCKYLMKLNDDWENLIRDVGYFSFGRKIRDDKGNEMVEKAKGITMMSALFCSNGGLITPVRSGQTYFQIDVETDFKNGVYSEEDFYILVDVVMGEANTLDGMVAVAYEILNRCKSKNLSIKEVVTPSQYRGYQNPKWEIPDDPTVLLAVVGALRGEIENPIGDIEYHFGKIEGNDLWADKTICEEAIVIGEEPYKNVFYMPWGSVHNSLAISDQNESNAIKIYDGNERKWYYENMENVISQEKDGGEENEEE